jgi:hypothetical protein
MYSQGYISTSGIDIPLDGTYNQNEMYFVGGTALAYYLNHRISEDIDIVSAKTLPYRKIIPSITTLGAT